jgi:alkylhydroperoxidase family enzyme
MQRVEMIQREQAKGRAKELLATVEQAFGVVPNATRVMANSPAVLDSFLSFSTAMGTAKIGDKLHTQVKLAASEANACSYCTSILCALGSHSGLTAADLVEGRSARAADRRADAALKFGRAVLETRGKVTDDDLRVVRKAGFDDGEIVEIVASVVLGCFTNFLNNVAQTDLDVPEAAPLAG